ncbi:MAG TPA: hypothetical protein VFN37_09350 [Candidatus Baltobacteraceae bacterium]|nr:hypothetical protein [Candidatus Baltobacteraceae bacterium]
MKWVGNKRGNQCHSSLTDRADIMVKSLFVYLGILWLRINFAQGTAGGVRIDRCNHCGIRSGPPPE